jgi:hypothetical protein
MKKITLLLSALFIVALANAQSNKEEIDLMQASFGMEKKAMVAEFVKVDDSQKDAFWKLYDEYETARKDLGKRRIDMLEKYAKDFDKLTNEKADPWGTELIDLSKKNDALIVTYYNKIKKVTSPLAALQFYMVENYILTGIRLTILEGIPFPEKKK